MSEKATGWDARDPRGHNVFVEANDGEPNHYRWACSCPRAGSWVKSKSYAEALGRRHAERHKPKRSEQRFSELQQLLSLTYPSARD